jgi:hypothetical protein
MTAKALFGADRELKRFKTAARTAPAFSGDQSSASIVALIYYTCTVRC